MPEMKFQSSKPNNQQAVNTVTSDPSKMNSSVEPETPSGFDIRDFLKVDTPTAENVNAKSKSLFRRQDSISTILS